MKTKAIIGGLLLGAATLVSCSDDNESIEPQPATSYSTNVTDDQSNARTAVTLSGQFTVIHYLYKGSEITSRFSRLKLTFLSSGELIVYNGETKYRGYYKQDQANKTLYIDIQTNDHLVNLLVANPWKIEDSDYRSMKLIAMGREAIREMKIQKYKFGGPMPAATVIKR